MSIALLDARTAPSDFRVDGWLVQPALNRLVKGDTTVRVPPQVIDVIARLAVQPGEVVTREQLLASVWSDRYICPSGVARCVSQLRKFLEDDARRPRIIETISKRGYRLIASVERGSNGSAPADLAGPGAAPVARGLTAPPPESGTSDPRRPLASRARGLLARAAGLLVGWRHAPSPF
jgi:DNA-binding winged helix-turn-helix (wHTH) protein